MLGKVNPETEIAADGETSFSPIKAWPFADTLFPAKRKFEFRPADGPKPFAPLPLEITGEQELREIMRRDPNDVRVSMLLNLVKERATYEGRPIPELLAEFFAQKQAELAANPKRQNRAVTIPEPEARPIKNVTPQAPSLPARFKSRLDP
jgi:hypothetical protein